MMSYLRELAEDTVELLESLACELKSAAVRTTITPAQLGGMIARMEGRAAELAKLCELAEPELWTAPAWNAPAVSPGVTVEDLEKRLDQEHVDAGQGAQVSTTNIGDGPIWGLQIQSLLRDAVLPQTFAQVPAVISLHLESVDDEGCSVELCVCDGSGEPVAAWFPRLELGHAWTVPIARADLVVQLDPPSAPEVKGG